jgi:hypothetical protein
MGQPRILHGWLEEVLRGSLAQITTEQKHKVLHSATTRAYPNGEATCACLSGGAVRACPRNRAPSNGTW